MLDLINGDCIQELKRIDSDSVDMIFADPPYFLSNGGISYNSGHVVSVNKGEWDKVKNINIIEFTNLWIQECYRVLKENGVMFVTGTHHNIFDVGTVLKSNGFNFVNLVIWEKKDPPPLIVKNRFRYSNELICFVRKGKNHYFDYNYAFKVNNTEMKDVILMDSVTMSEKKFGRHPTMKPVKLLKLLVKLTTRRGNIVLDPFMGSGTTGVAATLLGRDFIGIEKEKKYFELAQKRIGEVRN